MIDLKLLQKDFEHVSKELQRKNVGLAVINLLKERNAQLKATKQPMNRHRLRKMR